MKLLSMTEYVLWIRSMTLSELCRELPRDFKMPKWNGNKDDMVKDMLAHDAIKWRLVGEHAKLLKKPLQLGMFVPVSGKGEVLEDPLDVNCVKLKRCTCGEEDYNDCREWKHELREAKEKVLFEGFELQFLTERISFYRNGHSVFTYSFVQNGFLGTKTIEKVIGWSPEINESAIQYWT